MVLQRNRNRGKDRVENAEIQRYRDTEIQVRVCILETESKNVVEYRGVGDKERKKE
jgi:hypothetical protein